jgi:pilus assembly protein Flp/PilA
LRPQSHMTLFTLTLNGLIMNFIKNFIAEEDGVTAIEYALIAALISAVLVTAVGLMSGGLKTVFDRITLSLK